MNFGEALSELKSGRNVARAGWNGMGLHYPGSTFAVSRAPLLGIYPEGTVLNYCPHVDMRTADGKIVPWSPAQADVLADDWELLP